MVEPLCIIICSVKLFPGLYQHHSAFNLSPCSFGLIFFSLFHFIASICYKGIAYYINQFLIVGILKVPYCETCKVQSEFVAFSL